jgi:hypothetical protein
MLLPALRQPAFQLRRQRPGQHHHAILAALAVADGELVPPEVEVVDAHRTAFLPPQPRAVEQAGHQPVQAVAPLHRVEEAAHFLGRQDGGQSFGPPGPQGVEPGQLDAQHLLIEEQQGVERLVLRAGRDVVVGRQVGQEAFDFRCAHRVRVAQAVEANEAFGPGGVAVLGAGRELAHATGPPEPVEEAGRLGAGQLADRQAQDVMVEEGESGVGFFERVQGIFFGVGDVFEEAADVARGKVAGVAFVVEQDQAGVQCA